MSTSQSWPVGLLGAAICAAATSAAVAQTLPVVGAATYLVSATVDVDQASGGANWAYSRYITTPGTLSDMAAAQPGAPTLGSGSAYASISPTPSPTLYTVVEGNADFAPGAALHDHNGAFTQTTMHYQTMVNGPTAQVQVAVSWNVFIGLSPQAPGDDSNSAAGAAFELSLAGTPLLDKKVNSYEQFQPVNLASAGSQIVTMTTGVDYDVTLGANASVEIRGYEDPIGNRGGGTEKNFAGVDPTFAIAAGVPNAGAYTFALSPGVGNIAAVPEPASAALFIAGLLVIIMDALGRPGTSNWPARRDSNPRPAA